MVNALRIHPDDNVVMALSDLPAGTVLDLGGDGDVLNVRTLESIPFGHKVAIRPIQRETPVIKYGASIGLASDDITPGQHVHVHNLRSVRGAATS
ncbi:MAG TPA: UxaA family hydrolase [Chloroflexi bacterium]|jgi:altronate dehydratase small subunit|nr:UxaA family hydrolase [Chloroflexota bacterium]